MTTYFPLDTGDEKAWIAFEEELKEYYRTSGTSPRIYEIYELASAPHDSMGAVSASMGGFSVGVRRVQELLVMVQQYARMAIEAGKDGNGDIREAEDALRVLSTVKTEWENKETPDAKKVDQALTAFVQKRIEKFFSTLDERMKLEGVSLDEITKESLKIPQEQNRDLDAGMRQYLRMDKLEDAGDRRQNVEQLYEFLKDYPAVFMSNVLHSIDEKIMVAVGHRGALNPMRPMSEYKRMAREREAHS